MSQGKTLSTLVFPLLLLLGGGALLITAMSQGQPMPVVLGTAMMALVGLLMLLFQYGIISRKVGLLVGVLAGVVAVYVAYLDYRAVAGELEIAKARKENNTKVVQALKDVRAAQIAFEQAHGEYSANVQELREFVRTGEMPVVRAIGQKPDTLSEEEAIELGIIVRDTFTVAVLDTLFLNYANATDERVFKFDLDRFGISPGSGKPFIMRKGRVNAGGRDMPVFLVTDPQPFPGSDTLMVGSLDRPSTSGTWSE